MNQKEYLFYDGPQDSLEKSILLSGKTKKAVATVVYPDCQPETAKSRLSRALSTEHTDVNVSIGNLLTIMRETRPDDFIYYLCDEFGFERPAKKTSDRIRQDIASEVIEINRRLGVLIRQLPESEAVK
jgi:hypothetical protein